MAKTLRKNPKVHSINGVTMVTGATGYLVRNKTASWLNPVPSDWRTNPTDVVHVTIVGWDPSEEEYVFDDGRAEEDIFMTASPENAEREFFADRLQAEKAARREGRYLAKKFAQEDYSRYEIRVRFLRKTSSERRALIRQMTAAQLGELVRSFGQDPYRLFRGLSGMHEAKQNKVIALTCGLKVQARVRLISEAREAMAALEAQWGKNVMCPRAKGIPRKGA